MREGWSKERRREGRSCGETLKIRMEGVEKGVERKGTEPGGSGEG